MLDWSRSGEIVAAADWRATFEAAFPALAAGLADRERATAAGLALPAAPIFERQTLVQRIERSRRLILKARRSAKAEGRGPGGAAFFQRDIAYAAIRLHDLAAEFADIEAWNDPALWRAIRAAGPALVPGAAYALEDGRITGQEPGAEPAAAPLPALTRIAFPDRLEAASAAWERAEREE